MINIDDVKNILSLLASKSVEELDEFDEIINHSISAVLRLVGEANIDDRVVYLAAAKANYDICLVARSDDVTSFKAGDISITQGSLNRRESAKMILESAMKDASDVMADNGFAFLGV